jgi:hypothetical protein
VTVVAWLLQSNGLVQGSGALHVGPEYRAAQVQMHAGYVPATPVECAGLQSSEIVQLLRVLQDAPDQPSLHVHTHWLRKPSSVTAVAWLLQSPATVHGRHTVVGKPTVPLPQGASITRYVDESVLTWYSM